MAVLLSQDHDQVNDWTIGIPHRQFPGIGTASIPGREFPGILKVSGLSRIFVQNVDKIQQNSRHLLL